MHCSFYQVDCFVGFGGYFIYSLEENDGWQKLIKSGVHTSHTEEATRLCYMSLVNFGTWPYYNLMVGMVFCFYFSCVILILNFQVGRRWSYSRE